MYRPSALVKHHRGSSCCSYASTSGTSDDEKHLKTYSLRATGIGGTTTATVRGHTIQTDLPRTMGGKDEHPQPVELLARAELGRLGETRLSLVHHGRCFARYPLSSGVSKRQPHSLPDR